MASIVSCVIASLRQTATSVTGQEAPTALAA